MQTFRNEPIMSPSTAAEVNISGSGMSGSLPDAPRQERLSSTSRLQRNLRGLIPKAVEQNRAGDGHVEGVHSAGQRHRHAQVAVVADFRR